MSDYTGHQVALKCARTILEDMKAGLLPQWMNVELSGTFVKASLINWNQGPLSPQITKALAHLRELAPYAPRTRRTGGGGRPKTIRGFVDSWEYLGYCEPPRPDDRDNLTPFLLVRYDERHIHHDWRGYGPHGESDPTKAAIDWRCYTCSRRPTAKQRADAGIPPAPIPADA